MRGRGSKCFYMPWHTPRGGATGGDAGDHWPLVNGGDTFPPVGETGGISPLEIDELPIFLTGIFFQWKMGPFEKIDQIRGVFNFWGSFGVHWLGPDPPAPKSMAPPLSASCKHSFDEGTSSDHSQKLWARAAPAGCKTCEFASSLITS